MLQRNLAFFVCALGLAAGAGCVTQGAFDSHLEDVAATQGQVSALQASSALLEERTAAVEEEMAAVRSQVAERLERAEAQMEQTLAHVNEFKRELARMTEDAGETARAQRALVDSVLARIGGLTEEQEAARELLSEAQERVRKTLKAQKRMAEQQAEQIEAILTDFGE